MQLLKGTAKYQGERVDILDEVYVAGMREPEYLINYGGPIWVKASCLNNIIWFID